jgi:hypothetical protein
MPWWWLESVVKTSYHLIKLYTNCVLVVIENIDRYYDCYTKVDVSYEVLSFKQFVSYEIMCQLKERKFNFNF